MTRVPGAPARLLPQLPINRNLYIGNNSASSNPCDENVPRTTEKHGGQLPFVDHSGDVEVPSASISNDLVAFGAASASIYTEGYGEE